MSERGVWVYGVPSAVAWAIVSADRTAVPLHRGIEVEDVLLLRAARAKAGDRSVLALLGYQPDRLPRGEIVALATVDAIAGTVDEIPSDQRRWTSQPSALLRDVERIRPFEWPLGGAVTRRQAVPELLEVVKSRRIR